MLFIKIDMKLDSSIPQALGGMIVAALGAATAANLAQWLADNNLQAPTRGTHEGFGKTALTVTCGYHQLAAHGRTPADAVGLCNHEPRQRCRRSS